MNLEALILSAQELPPVPLQACHAYHEAEDEMSGKVDVELAGRTDIMQLIGNNPLQMMYDNHKHHAAFMASVFSISGYELLARTIPWVYRAYSAHGFSYDYFPVELREWKVAVLDTLTGSNTDSIVAIYDWMLDKHSDMVALSTRSPSHPMPVSEEWLEVKNTFIDGLLEGDHRSCMELARHYVKSTGSILSLYQQIIQPAMYEIGQLWEQAEVSFAQEHLASAVITKILLGISDGQPYSPPFRGKAVVTTSHNEFHEIGAWMVADLLEQDGWETQYLGTNTASGDVLQTLNDFLPSLLIISVTMSFNLGDVRTLIRTIRHNPVHAGVTILVGGRVFIDNPELVAKIGADLFAANLDEMLRLTRALEHQNGYLP